MPALAFLLALFIASNATAKTSECGTDFYTSDRPTIMVVNKVARGEVTSNIEIQRQRTTWTSEFVKGEGIYLVYQLDDNSPIYVSPFNDRILLGSTGLSVGFHKVSIRLEQEHELLQRRNYCFKLSKADAG